MHVYHSQTTHRLKGDQHCKIKGKTKRKKKKKNPSKNKLLRNDNMITIGQKFSKVKENFKFQAGTGENRKDLIYCKYNHH